MAKNKIPKKLERYLDEVGKVALRHMAEDVSWEIEKNYECIIDEFYRHYTPKVYDRNFNTYLASSGYNNMFDKTSIRNIRKNKSWERIATAGIIVSPKFIPGEPYKSWDKKTTVDKEWVFKNTFEAGKHGALKQPVFSPSPRQRMDEWFQDFKKTDNPQLRQFSSNAFKYAFRTVRKGV